MRRVVVTVLLVLLAPLAVRCDPPARTLAITIDDLPYIPGAGGAAAFGSLADARRATEAILGALARHKAPAIGFVNEARLQVAGERDARVELLKRWADAGMLLGNHTFSHLRLQDTPPERYQDDIVRGDVVTRSLMEGRGAPLFFRYPYNSTGPTKEIKEGIQSFLGARGYRLAPFTVEHADYIFDKIRWAAREKGDRDLEARTRGAYLAHLDTMLDFAERLSRETFGREIPQVLLIHASDLNADCLDEMLTKMERRGYRFVSLEEALKDPAFATPDEYVGPAGISWLHRWSVGLGLPMKLRDEPDPPQWVLDLYKNLS
jgi:peptidoglycan/xylan/chitin deacetylase (PgdA/CDA1 family)